MENIRRLLLVISWVPPPTPSSQRGDSWLTKEAVSKVENTFQVHEFLGNFCWLLVVCGVGPARVGKRGRVLWRLFGAPDTPIQRLRTWVALPRKAQRREHPPLREEVSEKEGFLGWVIS